MIEPFTLFGGIVGACSAASKLTMDFSKLIIAIKNVPKEVTQVSNEIVALGATLSSLQQRFNPLSTGYSDEQLSTINTVVDNTKETLIELTKLVEQASAGEKKCLGLWRKVGFIWNADEITSYRSGLIAYTTMLNLLTATLADQRAASTEAMVARVLVILEGNNLARSRSGSLSSSSPIAPPIYTEKPSIFKRPSFTRSATQNSSIVAPLSPPKRPSTTPPSSKSSSKSSSPVLNSQQLPISTDHRVDFAGKWRVHDIRVNGSFLGAGVLHVKKDNEARRVLIIIRLDNSRESRLCYRWLDTSSCKKTKPEGWVSGPSFSIKGLSRGDDDLNCPSPGGTTYNVRVEDLIPMSGQRSLLIAASLIKQLPDYWLQRYASIPSRTSSPQSPTHITFDPSLLQATKAPKKKKSSQNLKTSEDTHRVKSKRSQNLKEKDTATAASYDTANVEYLLQSKNPRDRSGFVYFIDCEQQQQQQHQQSSRLKKPSRRANEEFNQEQFQPMLRPKRSRQTLAPINTTVEPAHLAAPVLPPLVFEKPKRTPWFRLGTS